MAERRIHLSSLVTGLLALTFAGLYLLHHAGVAAVDEYVVGAAVPVVLGAAGAALSLRRLLSRRGGSG